MRRQTLNGVCIGFALWGLVGCARGPSEQERRARLSRLEEEGRALGQAGTALEVRLMADLAEVELWTELGTRHQQVSALACRNLSSHEQAMEHFSVEQAGHDKELKKQALARRWNVR